MTGSFQEEIPRARVNITLDVDGDGSPRRVDLPFKALVIGDFSRGRTQGKVVDRPRVEVSRDNLEAVLQTLAPAIRFTVPNQLESGGGEIPVSLCFQHMRDFRPEAVATRIEPLARLLAMRNLLRELKSSMLDNAAFRRELERIIRDRHDLAALNRDLQTLTPLAGPPQDPAPSEEDQP
ncbi:type VI secretion system contractile sheath small subunit [Ectothiorhodospira lacustris]|uniref:type VI secretion system contractile sheath small subunit n=1 Tax=Ectothiorhodospira lacustris TaxID=2899127 RepID=UPI001EE78885|nr:type VI secretion system contractile sheath small subunit [Ectothiorhodospira lacustris]MCG5499362.1 type VI secretion system contractile sheath small subunit [Ectothiorhodospira lacustris]